MATPYSNNWIVVIFVEDNEHCTKVYRKPQNTSLGELMNTWKEELQLNERWIFKSVDEIVTYDDESITLERIGEAELHSKYLAVKAEPFEKIPKILSVDEIFVFLNSKCHQFQIKPHQNLGEVVWGLQGSNKLFKHDGALLNLYDTFAQTEVKNNTVIYESNSQIPVKLSSGVTRIIQMQPDSIVLHLIEKVNLYETSAFSLIYDGRQLHPQDSIRELKHLVEVATVEFTVHIDDQCVRWKTKSGAITFPDFLSELSVKGKIPIQKLAKKKFYCVGCQRCICNSDDYVQLMQVQCCKEQSLTLNVKQAFDTGKNEDNESLTEYIQSLDKILVGFGIKESRKEDLRNLCRNMEQRINEKILDYNDVIKHCESFMNNKMELENKIIAFKVSIEENNNKIEKLEREIDALLQVKCLNTQFAHEINILKDENKKLAAAANKMDDSVNKPRKQNDNFMAENEVMKDDDRKLKDEKTSAAQTANSEAIHAVNEATQSSTETSPVTCPEILPQTSPESFPGTSQEISSETPPTTSLNRPVADPEVPEKTSGTPPNTTLKEPVEDVGVKLLVFYSSAPNWSRHRSFYPAVRRREMKDQGKYPWSGSSHIKCDISGMCAGWVSYEEILNALKPLFIGNIERITQFRGSVAGEVVVEVTSKDKDEAQQDSQKMFCSVDGCKQYSWYNVVGLRYENIKKGDSILICRGRQRTVLMITEL